MLFEAMLAHLGAMLGYVGLAGCHLGATWRQDETQERQDEPRWRTGAPRRSKIGELRRQGLLLGGRDPRGRSMLCFQKGDHHLGFRVCYLKCVFSRLVISSGIWPMFHPHLYKVECVSSYKTPNVSCVKRVGF